MYIHCPVFEDCDTGWQHLQKTGRSRLETLTKMSKYCMLFKYRNKILKGVMNMIYSQEVENMCPVAQGVHHGCSTDSRRSKMGKGKRS